MNTASPLIFLVLCNFSEISLNISEADCTSKLDFLSFENESECITYNNFSYS